MYERYGLKVYTGDDWVWYMPSNISEIRETDLDVCTFRSVEEAEKVKFDIENKYTKVEISILRASWLEEEFVLSISNTSTNEINISLPDSLILKMGWDSNTELDWDINDSGEIIIKSIS